MNVHYFPNAPRILLLNNFAKNLMILLYFTKYDTLLRASVSFQQYHGNIGFTCTNSLYTKVTVERLGIVTLDRCCCFWINVCT